MYIYAILYIYIYSRICFYITTTHINNYIHHFLGLSIQHIIQFISTNFLVKHTEMKKKTCAPGKELMRINLQKNGSWGDVHKSDAPTQHWLFVHYK